MPTKMTSTDGTRITATVSPENAVLVRKLASTTGIPLSWYMNNALTQFFQAHGITGQSA